MGKFIALEGIDGAGKGTIAQALQTALCGGPREFSDHEVEIISFPRYTETEHGKRVGRYLNGDYGQQVHPQVSCLLYAGDRRESLPYLRTLLKDNDCVIADRYTLSNIAYHCAKLKRLGHPAEEASELELFLRQLEHEMPEPNMTVLLRIPVELAAANVKKKMTRRYTNKQADLHEADLPFLEQVAAEYEVLFSYGRSDRMVVNVASSLDSLRAPEEIAAEIVTKLALL